MFIKQHENTLLTHTELQRICTFNLTHTCTQQTFTGCALTSPCVSRLHQEFIIFHSFFYLLYLIVLAPFKMAFRITGLRNVCTCVSGVEWVWAGRAGDLGLYTHTHTPSPLRPTAVYRWLCVCVWVCGVGGFVSEGAVEWTQSLLCFHKTCGMCEQKQMCLI